MSLEKGDIVRPSKQHIYAAACSCACLKTAWLSERLNLNQTKYKGFQLKSHQSYISFLQAHWGFQTFLSVQRSHGTRYSDTAYNSNLTRTWSSHEL